MLTVSEEESTDKSETDFAAWSTESAIENSRIQKREREREREERRERERA